MIRWLRYVYSKCVSLYLKHLQTRVEVNIAEPYANTKPSNLLALFLKFWVLQDPRSLDPTCREQQDSLSMSQGYHNSHARFKQQTLLSEQRPSGASERCQDA